MKLMMSMWPRWLRRLVSHVDEYCKVTTFHGFRYISEHQRHWIERVFWLGTTVFCLAAAVVLIGYVWTQYSTSPTITTVENTHYPIWSIPFPAVTICNVNKVDFHAAQRLYRQSGLDAILSEDKYFSFIEQLAEIIQPEHVAFTFNITEVESKFHERNLSMENLMLQMTQPCSSLMVKCKWRGELTDCSELFILDKSDSGFCCTFNYRPSKNVQKEFTPRRVNGAGYLGGVTMLMDPRLEDYYAALFSFYGFQVLIHSPKDYPEIMTRGLILAPRKEAFLQVTASTTRSTGRVRSLSVEQRNCLFEDERDVVIGDASSGYTHSNCLMNCRLQHMAQICNCTPYFYPDQNTVRQCGLQDVECLANHRSLNFASYLVEREEGLTYKYLNPYNKSNMIFNNLRSPAPVAGLSLNDKAKVCDCPPSCNDVMYMPEISMGDFFASEYDRTHFFKEVKITNHSILHVYFKDISVLLFRRDVHYSWNDLLASFGGITGLCLGSSLLSFVELMYFFTIRPIFTRLHKYRQNNTTKITYGHFPFQVYPENNRKANINNIKTIPIPITTTTTTRANEKYPWIN